MQNYEMLSIIEQGVYCVPFLVHGYSTRQMHYLCSGRTNFQSCCCLSPQEVKLPGGGKTKKRKPALHSKYLIPQTPQPCSVYNVATPYPSFHPASNPASNSTSPTIFLLFFTFFFAELDAVVDDDPPGLALALRLSIALLALMASSSGRTP